MFFALPFLKSMDKKLLAVLAACLCLAGSWLAAAEGDLVLRRNLMRAAAGDYIVTAQNKNYTILLVRSTMTGGMVMVIEEITLPMARVPANFSTWRQWVESGAPGHTCWVSYEISLMDGSILKAFSFTKNEWFTVPQSQNFLSTLLNLQLTPIPLNERKKVGPPPNAGTPDRRSFWQPQMVVDGQLVPGVQFDGWRTKWPKDGSELSGKSIEVFVPHDQGQYPAYFPYWLQISGMVGKAKVRIVDSGSQLFSPAQLPQGN